MIFRGLVVKLAIGHIKVAKALLRLAVSISNSFGRDCSGKIGMILLAAVDQSEVRTAADLSLVKQYFAAWCLD